MHDGRQEYDLNLRVIYKDFYVEGLYINKNKGPFIGPQSALNDESDVETNYVFVDVGYKKTFEERFTIKHRVYYDQFDDNIFIGSLPEGGTLDRNGDGFPDTRYPDGLIGNGKVIEKIVGTEIPFDYKLFDGNIITLGLDLIVLRTAESANEPSRFENFVDAHLQGVETETRLDITKDNYYVFISITV